jgi:hypothetical protein
MEPAAASSPRVNVAKFGIGFCPGCQRLRSVASARCSYCGSAKPVTIEDA